MPTKNPSDNVLRHIEIRDRRLKIWMRVFVISGLIVLGCLLALAFKNEQAGNAAALSQARQLAHQNEILNKLDQQAAKRDKNLQLLITDNAKQTVILCTLIIRSGQSLTDADAVNIQDICKQEIQSANDLIDGSKQSVASPTSSQSSSGSQATPTTSPQPSTQKSPQADPPPQPVRVLGIPACIPFTSMCFHP